jgi:hypothetical protein
MTWTRLHERTLMAEVIDRAAENLDAAADLDGSLPGAEWLFD